MKSLAEMLLDSVVVAGISLFSTSGDVNSLGFWFVGVKAFGAAFFIQLAIERGLKRDET